MTSSTISLLFSVLSLIMTIDMIRQSKRSPRPSDIPLGTFAAYGIVIAFSNFCIAARNQNADSGIFAMFFFLASTGVFMKSLIELYFFKTKKG